MIRSQYKTGDKVRVIKDISLLSPKHRKWANYIVTVDADKGSETIRIKEFGHIIRYNVEKVNFLIPEELFEI